MACFGVLDLSDESTEVECALYDCLIASYPDELLERMRKEDCAQCLDQTNMTQYDCKRIFYYYYY